MRVEEIACLHIDVLNDASHVFIIREISMKKLENFLTFDLCGLLRLIQVPVLDKPSIICSFPQKSQAQCNVNL